MNELKWEMKVSSCDHFNTPWIKVFNLFTTKKLDSVKRRSLPSWDGNKNKRQPIHPGNSSSSLSVFGGISQKARNLSQSHPNVSRINKLAHDLLGIKSSHMETTSSHTKTRNTALMIRPHAIQMTNVFYSLQRPVNSAYEIISTTCYC